MTVAFLLRSGSFPPRIQHDLRQCSFLSRNTLYISGRLFNGNAMADHETGIDLSVLDAIEQRLHVAHHVGLAGLQREPFFMEAPRESCPSNPA